MSIARRSPAGWEEPGQQPEVDEFTVVRGLLRVEHESGTLDVRQGQEVIPVAGKGRRYSTPESGGAEYTPV